MPARHLNARYPDTAAGSGIECRYRLWYNENLYHLGKGDRVMAIQHTISVMIADDEASIRNGLKSAVDSMGLNVRVAKTAGNGIEAWNLIQENPPEIVITDIRMPLLDGLNLMKKCREALLDIEFIILSGFDDFSYAQSAIRYGARAYLLKPFKIEELREEMEVLEKEIQKKHSHSHSAAEHSKERVEELSRKLFLNQLIHNEFHYEEDLEVAIKKSGLSFHNGTCQIILFSVDSETSVDSQALIRLKQIMEYHMRDCSVQVWDNETFQLAALIFPPGAWDLADVRMVSDQIRKDWNRESNVRLTIGIGTKETDLTRAGQSYGMAVTALSYQMYEHGEQIFDSSIICVTPPPVSANRIDSAPLLDAIWSNDRKAITDWYHRYIQELFYVSMPPPGFIRGMCIYLVTDIQNTLKKQTEDCQDLIFDSPYIRLNELSFFRQMEHWCLSQFLQYGEILSEYRTFGKDRVITKAKLFIENHINSKISAELVAEAVNLSPSYFTIYFKSKTGINFRDYVLGRKMEKAKDLLTAADGNISEISYAVGYDDYRSFYRAFKNYTGQTPSEYQTRRRKGESQPL